MWIDAAVIVPADLLDFQRQTAKDAGKICGLKIEADHAEWLKDKDGPKQGAISRGQGEELWLNGGD